MDDEPQTWTTNPDGTLTINGMNMSIPVMQGPPGPAGTLEITGYDGNVITSLSDLARSGTRPVPELRFEVDGWEYSFPTKEHARMVREKLMEMTLEGEL